MRKRNKGECAGRLACLVWLVPLGFGSPIVDPTVLAQDPAGTSPSAPAVATDQPPAADLDSRIDQLIQQLGASEYATRQRAQEELQRLRLDAFDALNEAQLNDDIEIALTARYLVNSMQVNWSSEDDSPEVKQLLRGYGTRPEDDRRTTLDLLAARGADEATRPLCRLVRYEASEKLSKHAALRVMAYAVPEDAEGVQALADSLTARMGKSRRTAAGWLRAYAGWLNKDPNADAEWKEQVQVEKSRLIDMPELTSREIVRDLLKWYADQLARRDRNDDALAAMRTLISLLNSTPAEILDAVDWFRDRKCWEIVIEISEQFSDTFQRSAFLLYRLAEAKMQLGDAAKAESLAKEALQVGGEGLAGHLQVAANLQQDGLFEWAEWEYRLVAEKIDSDPREALNAKLYLSEMLHELDKDEAAGALLQEVVAAIDGNQELKAQLEEGLGRAAGSVKSRMYFFLAQHQASVGNVQACREQLLEGYQHDPNDADLLIGMFRLPNADEAWKQETRARIEATAQRFRAQIKDLQAEGGPELRESPEMVAYYLAKANNQLAWLIANTVGDPDEAIRCSRASLAIRPTDSGYLDTLGRCYYAKGDFANAVKYQKLAVAGEPHSPAMLKQLALFQQALDAQNANADENTSDKTTAEKPAAEKPAAESGDARAGGEGGK